MDSHDASLVYELPYLVLDSRLGLEVYASQPDSHFETLVHIICAITLVGSLYLLRCLYKYDAQAPGLHPSFSIAPVAWIFSWFFDIILLILNFCYRTSSSCIAILIEFTDFFTDPVNRPRRRRRLQNDRGIRAQFDTVTAERDQLLQRIIQDQATREHFQAQNQLLEQGHRQTMQKLSADHAQRLTEVTQACDQRVRQLEQSVAGLKRDVAQRDDRIDALVVAAIADKRQYDAERSALQNQTYGLKDEVDYYSKALDPEVAQGRKHRYVRLLENQNAVFKEEIAKLREPKKQDQISSQPQHEDPHGGFQPGDTPTNAVSAAPLPEPITSWTRYLVDPDETDPVYTERFPAGHELMATSGRDLQCALYALLRSYDAQVVPRGTNVPPLTLEWLQNCFRHHYPTQEMRNLDEIQVSKLWHSWGAAHGEVFQLGIYLPTRNSRLICHEYNPENLRNSTIHTLWIHNNLADHGGLALAHWEGMRPLEDAKVDAQAVTGVLATGVRLAADIWGKKLAIKNKLETKHKQEEDKHDRERERERARQEREWQEQKERDRKQEEQYQKEQAWQKQQNQADEAGMALKPLAQTQSPGPSKDAYTGKNAGKTLQTTQPPVSKDTLKVPASQKPLNIDLTPIIGDADNLTGNSTPPATLPGHMDGGSPLPIYDPMPIDSPPPATTPPPARTFSPARTPFPDPDAMPIDSSPRAVTPPPATPPSGSDIMPVDGPSPEAMPSPAGSDIMVIDKSPVTSPSQSRPTNPPSGALPFFPRSPQDQPATSSQTSIIHSTSQPGVQTVVDNPGTRGRITIPSSQPRSVPSSQPAPLAKTTNNSNPTKSTARTVSSSPRPSESGLSDISSGAPNSPPDKIYGKLASPQPPQIQPTPEDKYYAPPEKVTGTVEKVSEGGETDEEDYGDRTDDDDDNNGKMDETIDSADLPVHGAQDSPVSEHTRSLLNPSDREMAASPSPPIEATQATDPFDEASPTYPQGPITLGPSRPVPTTSPPFVGSATGAYGASAASSSNNNSSGEKGKQPLQSAPRDDSNNRGDGGDDGDDGNNEDDEDDDVSADEEVDTDSDDDSDDDTDLTDAERAGQRRFRASQIRSQQIGATRYLVERYDASRFGMSRDSIESQIHVTLRFQEYLNQELDRITALQQSERDSELWPGEEEPIEDQYTACVAYLKDKAARRLERVKRNKARKERRRQKEAGERSDDSQTWLETAKKDTDKGAALAEKNRKDAEKLIGQLGQSQNLKRTSLKRTENTTKQQNNAGKTRTVGKPQLDKINTGDKRRRRESDDGEDLRNASARTPTSTKRPTIFRPISRSIGALTTYSPITPTESPNHAGTPFEQARYRWYKQVEAQNRAGYLDEYIDNAKKDWETAGRPADLGALVTAAEQMRDETRQIESRILSRRTELGDTIRFSDIQLDQAPTVSKPDLKKRIKKRAEAILKGEGAMARRRTM